MVLKGASDHKLNGNLTAFVIKSNLVVYDEKNRTKP
jgi:hypothetical protein